MRALAASAALIAFTVALDVAWQRAFLPRVAGLEARYWPDPDRSGEPALVARDAELATGTLERRRASLGHGGLGVTWTGSIEAPAEGEYTFTVRSSGRFSLAVDGAEVVSSPEGFPREERTGTARLGPGRHAVFAQYASEEGEAALAVDWARDGQPRVPLSADALLPPRPDERSLRAFRSGRALFRALFLAAVALAVGAGALEALRRLRAPGADRLAAACLAGFVVAGLAALDDFGVSLDETMQRRIGLANYLYLSQGSSRLLDAAFPERYYGPAFELLLVGIEKQAGLSDSRTVFLARHAITFLFFSLALVFLYRLGVRHFRSRAAALFACLCLASSPRILAEAFYNSKDLPFLSAFVVSVYTMVRFLDEGTLRRAAWHALASALLVDIRVVGLLVPALTLALGAGQAVLARSAGPSLARRSASLAGYAALLALLVVAFFPFLWRSPLEHLHEVLATMSRFPFRRTVLYLGHDWPAPLLPWHYLPVWIGITTPLAQLALLPVGLVVTAASCLTSPARLFGEPRRRNRLVWLLWGVAPVVLVAASGAVVYDGWRHVYFVAPGLAMIATEGAVRVARWLRDRLPATGAPPGLARAAAAGAVVLVVAEPAAFLIRHHPHGNVYFNRLAGQSMRTIRDRFEVDYWGLSYRRGLEAVLRLDRRPRVRVQLRPGLGEASAAILRRRDRERLVFVERRRDADYLLGNFRWHRGDYAHGREVFSVVVGDASIMSVHDLQLDR